MPHLIPDVIPIDSSRFAPFGQVIGVSEDGKAYDGEDAQLVLDQGIPRLYLMRLHHMGMGFHRITRHRRCSQCLGSLYGQVWFLGVAPPHELGDPDARPHPEAIVIFAISGSCFVKLHPGTWHAGPYFTEAAMTFYNLELADTNVTDHHTCDLQATFGLTYEIVPPPVPPTVLLGSPHG